MAEKLTTLKVTFALRDTVKKAAIDAKVHLQEFTRVALLRHVNHVKSKGK